MPAVGDITARVIPCFSIKHLLPKGNNFLWPGSDEGVKDQNSRDYLEAVFGPECFWNKKEADPGNGFCLEELTPQLVSTMAVGHGQGDQAQGLASGLRPYLKDLVMRKQGLRGTADQIASIAESDPRLARPLADVTAKELFLTLVLSTPPSERAHLATEYAGLRAPLPLVFRATDGTSTSSSSSSAPGTAKPRLRTMVAFDLLRELACVPCPSRRLVVNLGTQLAVGVGKTSSLSQMELTSLVDEDLDLRPGGPMHAPSCDLICTEDARWVADMHGHWFGADEAFRTAVLALAAWGRAACLVHCGLGDFHPRTGAPRKELAAVLAELHSASVPAASGGTVPAKYSGAVLLVRDATQADLAVKRSSIEAALRQFGSPALLSLESNRGATASGGSSARGSARRTAQRDQLEEALAKLWGQAAELPGVDELYRIHQELASAGLRRTPAQRLELGLSDIASVAAALKPGSPPSPSGQPGSPRGKQQQPQQQQQQLRNAAAAPTLDPRLAAILSPAAPGLQPLGLRVELHRLLDQAHRSGSTKDALFPLSALDRRRRLLETQRAETRGARAARGSQKSAYEEEVRALDEKLEQAAWSEAMHFFCEVLSSEEPLAAISELSQALAAWREPRMEPLLTRQRELLDLQESEGKQHESRPHSIGHVSDELESVASVMATLDFSVDSFWAEMSLLSAHQQARGEVPESNLLKSATGWQKLLAAGHPFQLLHGRPLQLAGRLLRDVLKAIDAPQENPSGLFVVSVIGAQSSAKSTLLNFLFGCGFAVRAGRCTRGLYASYFKPSATGPALLVLDSEGLLSLSSEGNVFDGQIALMCMTCSHLVIVNNKGELSRQLQDLLEICLFATRHLRLARLQPRLVFVLRDQHDRSRTMHEDMLKRMRGHLEAVATTLGTPLEELVRLEGTAVFLLPSAITAELRQDKEVCWTSVLFSREVLVLRREIFRWLEEDMQRKEEGGALREFSSLEHWYDYAATVWETLYQFSDRLLHFKTIHEVEVRRELAEVAKAAAREALNAPQEGFHARARATVDRFVTRIQTTSTRHDLEKADLELVRELSSLRDECAASLEDLFQERSADPRFSATAKEQARLQIRTPIEWAFENHLYTWKLHLKRASDEREMQELWIHFVGILNRDLTSSGHRTCLSPEESSKLFNSEWRLYEASFLQRLGRLMKDRGTVVHEVTMVFNHAVGKLHNEAGALALLKEIGPQQVAGDPDRGIPAPRDLLEMSDDEWEEQFFATGWWDSVRQRGLALLQAAEPSGSVTPLRGRIMPRLRTLVQQGLQQFEDEVSSRGVLDESTAAEGLRHITGVVLHEIESRLLAMHSVTTLKRPQMLHALHLALRLTCVKALTALETSKQTKASADLFTQKADIEEHFLSIIQANKGDVERATSFAALYHRAILNWLDHEVTQLATMVRNQVLEEMPDPQKSSDRAFQHAFVSKRWPDVLEYVLDTTSYLGKIYLGVFHQRKKSFVGPTRAKLEKKAIGVYGLLQDEIGQWGRKDQGEDLVMEKTAEGQRSARGKKPRPIQELKDHIKGKAELPTTGSKEMEEAYRHLADCLPATAEFYVADAKLFADTVQARIADILAGSEVHHHLVTRLDRALQEQSVQAWSLVHGCSERCPLCGSKCDLVGEHANHHCAHHLFPAFHGWMDCTTGLPSFNHCCGAETRAGTYECKDGKLRSFEDYLRLEHPSWVAYLCTEQNPAGEMDLPHLRAAWVNCRQPLLDYFAPMSDDCPRKWIEDYHDEGRALTGKDLEVAKDTIRKLRRNAWVPPDD